MASKWKNKPKCHRALTAAGLHLKTKIKRKKKKGPRGRKTIFKKCFKIRKLLQILEPDNIQRSWFKKSLMQGLSGACKSPLLILSDSLSPSADWNNTSYRD